MQYLTQHWVLHHKFSTRKYISANLITITFNSWVKVFLTLLFIYYILLNFFLTVMFLNIHIFYFHWFYFLQTVIPSTKFLSARGISKTFLVCKFYFVKGNNNIITTGASTTSATTICSFNISSMIK